MKRIAGIYGIIAMGLFLFSLPSRVEGANVTVNCSFQSLQAAIKTAAANTKIIVKGTCNENVVIDVKKTKITIDGRGTATVNGPDITKQTIDVRGKDIVIKSLHITGGNNGIRVLLGATATIDGNTIDSADNNGVNINTGGIAFVINNTIHDNGNNGIEVHDNAVAHIGFVGYSDTAAQPNVIESNAKHGIDVQRSSSASIVGNIIQNNLQNGIKIQRDSHADIASNTIDGNGDDGIRVETNSGVNLGSDTGSSIFSLPNDTATPNVNNGISCDIGGYADGLLGTLNGSGGPTSFSNGCINSLL